MKTEEEFNKKWEPIYKERINHEEPSPETRERLKALEINQENIMDYLKENKEEHKELFGLVRGMDTKLDDALKSKADKSEVIELSEKVEDLKTWKIKIIAYGSVLLFLVTFFKDIIINFLKNI